VENVVFDLPYVVGTAFRVIMFLPMIIQLRQMCSNDEAGHQGAIAASLAGQRIHSV
jgi:hypothetical protein